jgi:hypothetical protein
VSKTIEYWVRWNALVDRAAELPHLTFLRYRVEDLDEDLIARIIELIGTRPSSGAIRRALQATSRTVNARPVKHRFSMDEVQRGMAALGVPEAARKYGYGG